MASVVGFGGCASAVHLPSFAPFAPFAVKRLRPSLKPIADIADGLNESRVCRIGLYLAAQRGHAAVDAAWGDHDGIAPFCIKDVAAGQGASWPSGEILEQAELFSGQFDFLILAEQFVRGQTQLVIAKVECVRRFRLSPPQEGIGSGQQFP